MINGNITEYQQGCQQKTAEWKETHGNFNKSTITDFTYMRHSITMNRLIVTNGGNYWGHCN
jgi:hypothetical protein